MSSYIKSSVSIVAFVRCPGVGKSVSELVDNCCPICGKRFFSYELRFMSDGVVFLHAAFLRSDGLYSCGYL